VIDDAARASPLVELLRPGNLVDHTRGQKWAKGHYRRADTIFQPPPPTTQVPRTNASSPPPPLPRPIVYRLLK
jgi:hypothetical protein